MKVWRENIAEGRSRWLYVLPLVCRVVLQVANRASWARCAVFSSQRLAASSFAERFTVIHTVPSYTRISVIIRHCCSAYIIYRTVEEREIIHGYRPYRRRTAAFTRGGTPPCFAARDERHITRLRGQVTARYGAPGRRQAEGQVIMSRKQALLVCYHACQTPSCFTRVCAARRA